MSDIPADLWLTRQLAALLCGLSARQFDDVIRPKLPSGSERGAGQKLRISGPAVVAALVAYRLEQAKPAASTDPMLVGDADSPALERFRAARADQEEMKRDEMARTHADLRELDTALSRYAGHLRRAGETLQRRFGNEASDILNEGIEEAAKAWETERQRPGREAR